ncbi:glycosyltransferase family 4 protein [Noviherbaspirillum saxi]|uniref:Glycosyltransferase n=1 Tax=Noviherbaspirillum saxi TaxID=2320863 RepID=A0A3A3GAK9_9BURK|nr:glycosyltransferase family 4 protein [Noviherbaspirillum saxi]RJF99215.1 glycosyltransferase [Noviherbaspirillum saxi]
MLRISLVSNELPPYRVPFFRALDRTPGVTLQVLFCTRREPNRMWDIPMLDFGHEFLHEHFITVRDRYIHNNPGVVKALHKFLPDVVITGGFNPTHLYAFAYALVARRPHIAMTDGTDRSERDLGRWHKAVRRIVYSRTAAFVSASQGGKRLHRSYGADDAACFHSCLCIDNAEFAASPDTPRDLDFLFCGRIEAVKNPLFAFEVALACARKLQRQVSIVFVGAGSQDAELRALARQHGDLVDARFSGFVAHKDLPGVYQSAKVFLFPSSWDPWGVVANEACAAGVPVLVSPHAGVAGELVVHGHNGYVEELELETWSDAAANLLSQAALWARFSRQSVAMANDYSYANAANGLLAACRHAMEQSGGTQSDVRGNYNAD